ncbi:hypothetical protein [uncultured Roseobacter sp.]|uniref:hypothetical protein n=1 Tax=uncultured Roseobacter sp. TaxID=114847 RepID=UPI00260C494B|nr:hypothetical protein [uncultured Roseobacter sp.]
MSEVIGFHGVPAPRRRLARQLRELADILDTDQSETEPHGIMMCLMGAAQFEVVGIGDTEGWSGARQAMSAVIGARFDTMGGNIRMRDHAIYQPRKQAEITPLVLSRK